MNIKELLEDLCCASDDVIYAQLRGTSEDEERTNKKFDKTLDEAVERLTDLVESKDKRIKTLEFMVENGLGWEDMKGGGIEDVM